MSRQEKINKLGRAVREYRGVFRGVDAKGNPIWRFSPQPAKRQHVIKCLQALQLGDDELELIDSLQSQEEFTQWIKTL